MVRRFLALIVLALFALAAAYLWVVRHPLPLPEEPFTFTVRPGATLRAVAHELTAASVLPADWTLVALARFEGVDRTIKAGNYELPAGTTLSGLLAKLTQGDVTQTSFTIVDGRSLRVLREALLAEATVAESVVELPVTELLRALDGRGPAGEGWVCPDPSLL